MGEGDEPGLSRRSVLLAGLAAAAGLGMAGVATAAGVMPGGSALVRSVAAGGIGPANAGGVGPVIAGGVGPVIAGGTGPAIAGGATADAVTAGGMVRTERVFSAARGREVRLVTITPGAIAPDGLPVCVALHGLHGDATAVVAGGMPGFLSAAVARRAIRPFAVVAVDGGDSYWHENTPGDDPAAMLTDELPRWLADRGLRPRPFAATGISMGGFGALHYARLRRERGTPLRAVAVIAPALITTWAEMRKRNAFHDDADWAAYDPLRNLPALGKVPVGVWCGTEDRFIDGVRNLIATGRPQVYSLGPGGHDDGYFRRALPEALRFIGLGFIGRYR
jgi:S-formylglutathione hydrolase FrmB